MFIGTILASDTAIAVPLEDLSNHTLMKNKYCRYQMRQFFHWSKTQPPRLLLLCLTIDSPSAATIHCVHTLEFVIEFSIADNMCATPANAPTKDLVLGSSLPLYLPCLSF